MSRAWLPAHPVLVLVLIVACAPAPARRDFRLGPHRFSLLVPRGWEVVDRGSEVLLRHGDASITVADFGPAGRPGVRREVDLARDAWSRGRDRDARWRLKRLRVPEVLFTGAERREAFWSAWSEIANSTDDTSDAEIGLSFERLGVEIDSLADRAPEALAEDALARLDESHRREVATRQPFETEGRSAFRFETWDKTTHAWKQRVALVFDRGYLLALESDPVRERDTARAFDLVLASLAFAPDEGGTVAAR